MSKRLFMKLTVITLSFIIVAAQLFGVLPVMQTSAATVDYFSPFDVAYSPDGTMIAVSDLTKAKLNIITASTGVISQSIQLNGHPKGIAWNGNTRVYVAEYDGGSVAEIDPAAGTVLNRILTGPKPAGLAVSNGKLVVTEFGLKYVTIVDLATRNILGNVSVKDYPYFVDITTDGQYAIVGHATPSGDASTLGFASSVTFVNINTMTVASNIALPMGSTNVRDIKCSPDGQWAYVAHTLGRTAMPTTQITKGWANTDAVSIINIANKSLYTTFLLDTIMEGAADPWGLTISSDSKTLWVSISGTHQVYKVDLYNLHQLLLGNIPGAGSTGSGWSATAGYTITNRTSNMLIDVPGGNATNGTQLIQWPSNGGNNQKWNIIDAGSGYYYIKSVGTGKCLDNKGSNASNAPIVEWDQTGSNNQQWSIVDVGGGYYNIICRSGGKALDNAGSTTQNTGIVQNTVSSGNNQQWKITQSGSSSTSPTLLFRSKAAFSKPYSDVWFAIKANPAKRTLLMNDLGALWSAGLLTKIKMPGQGPRGISIAPNGSKIAVGAYFAGQVYMLDTVTNQVTQTINLGSQPAENSVRRGERTFHDASTTTQKWLSCATCHPEGRADGLDWDMPNDGIGNSKNTKSMYKVFETPPAMWRGVREDAYVGVLAGFKFIKFKVPTQQELDDVAAYIQSFNEEVSPYRDANGAMTADALAGKAIFESAEAQCATCHTGNNLTDLKVHDVGTKDAWDIDGNYITPPIEEMWRTAPYLHDGSAATMRDVLTTRNVGDKHGKTSHLTSTQIDQLAAYLLQVSAPTGPDTQAPTAPANLVSTGKTDTSVSLSWTASTDNVAVTGYNIYSGTDIVGSSTGTAYTVKGLTGNTAYTFTVKAKDFAGNISAESNACTVTTEAPDTQAPSAPADLASTGKTDTSVSLSWTASTDNVGVTAYDVYSGSNIVGSATGTAYTVTGLTENTAYTFTVKARDAAGNVSVESNALAVTTNAAKVNVALNKTASASSAETANGVVKGNDGSTSTRWCASSGALNEWWMVDLGSRFNLTDSEITWESAKNYKYKIETSPDNVTWTVASDKTANTSSSQVQTDTLTASDVQYVRVTVTGLPSGAWASFYEFKVFGTPVPNVALNKTASASSAQTANGVANGNDGSTSTRWCASSEALNEWWMVDLGGNFNLTGSEITWESAKNYKYKIETSPDNATWTVASDKTANTGTTQVQTDTFSASGVRYVRITVTGLPSGTWASFYEFKLSGSAV